MNIFEPIVFSPTNGTIPIFINGNNLFRKAESLSINNEILKFITRDPIPLNIFADFSQSWANFESHEFPGLDSS